MRGGAKKGWRWRVADREKSKDLNLLYEPGNWGDVIKGLWAATTARALVSGRKEIRYLDPFAGGPTYPLLDASARRIETVPVEWFRTLQEPYLKKGLLPSTALLVSEAVKAAGGEARLKVFDTDPVRLEAWRSLPNTEILPVLSGEAALESLRPEDVDFVLIDPYDLFVKWQVFLPAILKIAARLPVLAYAYNRAPRGPGQQRMYGDFRKAIEKGTGPATGILIGRIPADATIARAYHEVLLAGPEKLVRGVRQELADLTRTLARTLAEMGAFEELLPPAT